MTSTTPYPRRHYWPTGNLVPLEWAPVRTRRATVVYVLDADHAVKIGITAGTVEQRAEDIARASGIRPTIVTSFTFKEGRYGRRVETVAHWLLRDCRTHGEWFHCRPVDAVSAVKKATLSRTFADYIAWADLQRAARIEANQ